MKMKFLSLIFFLPLFSFGQIFTDRPLNEPAIGSASLTDQFIYNDKSIGHYSLGWYIDPWCTGAPTGYLSGCGGLKFFTAGVSRISISVEGNIAIGTPSGTSRLTVLKNFSAIDNTSVSEFKMTDAGIDNSITFLYKNTGGGQSNINFIDAQANGNSIFTLNGLGNAFLNGNMAIGTPDSKGYKLAVAGGMIAESVKVKLQSAWPDYIFNKDYKLLSLDDIEAYIKKNHHLPEMPSASDIEKTGLDLGIINTKLLQKIEELTLYIIDLKKGNLELKENIAKQQLLNDEISIEITKIKKVLNY